MESIKFVTDGASRTSLRCETLNRDFPLSASRSTLHGGVALGYELDEGKRKPRAVDDDFLNEVKLDIGQAAESLLEQSASAAPRKRS
jgi:hypothetical protein